MKVLASNKKAYFNYEVLDKYEAGIVLKGWEVKSIRHGQINLREGFVKVRDNEVWLTGVHISRWKTQSKREKIDPGRDRKLLLKNAEIKRLIGKIQNKSVTIVPLQAYLSNNNKIKIEVGVVRGKRKYDKREKLKEKDLKRQIERDLSAGDTD